LDVGASRCVLARYLHALVNLEKSAAVRVKPPCPELDSWDHVSDDGGRMTGGMCKRKRGIFQEIGTLNLPRVIGSAARFVVLGYIHM
jgi:hypothetical protein